MSEIETVPTPDLQVVFDTARRLLSEYTGKLNTWVAEGRPLYEKRLNGRNRTKYDESEWSNQQERLNRIRPACSDLSRMASGLIEQSRIDFAQRTEIRLRLAEFESNLLLLDQMFSTQPQPSNFAVV